MRHFLDFLFPPRSDERIIRDLSADDFSALALPCLVPETRPETAALLSFGDPRVRAAVHEAKYHGSAHAFALLAAVLADYLRDSDEKLRAPVLLPVPLGKKRLKERGFNQVEEVLMRAARELGVVVDAALLERVKETQTQVSLERSARERNMRGAFRGMRSADPSRTYILVDDVITTGATLQTAIDALRGAGATHIIPLALAH